VRLLEAAPGPKYKAALSAAYGAGLRVSEVVPSNSRFVPNAEVATEGVYCCAGICWTQHRYLRSK